MSKTRNLSNTAPTSIINALVVPTGTTAQRPTLTPGYIRFNTDLNTLESANTTAWANVGSGSASAGGSSISWQPVQNTNFIAVAGNGYGVNTATNSVVITLPSSPTVGQQIQLFDYAQTFSANGIILYPNGNKINGNTVNVLVQSSGSSFGLVYYDTAKGWVAYSGYPSAIIGPYSVDYLVVAGGGGGSGGVHGGGGGGAGGMLTGSSVSVTSGVSYTITVGSGGTASSSDTYGGNGNLSSFGLVASAVGGGGGGSGPNSGSYRAGQPGGSGGGAGRDASASGGSGTAGQGNPGGSTPGNSYASAAGGGGAGAAGGNGSNTGSGPTDAAPGGNGGVGSISTISGTSVYYAGGGGGSAYQITAGTGGTGGGGPGGRNALGTAGTANTGGGGGGGRDYGGGNGGSGVVVIRYLGNVQKASGGVVTITGGYVIHTFNSSGTFIA